MLACKKFRAMQFQPLRWLMRELSSAPQGHLFELLVLPGAERRGNQEFTAQLAHSPWSEAEGGTQKLSRAALCAASAAAFG